jgi:hypothetical protein
MPKLLVIFAVGLGLGAGAFDIGHFFVAELLVLELFFDAIVAALDGFLLLSFAVFATERWGYESELGLLQCPLRQTQEERADCVAGALGDCGLHEYRLELGRGEVEGDPQLGELQDDVVADRRWVFELVPARELDPVETQQPYRDARELGRKKC